MSEDLATAEAPVRDSSANTLSIDAEAAARAALRDQLAADVEAFLKSGGSIQSVPAGMRADPPKKPEPKYGGGSI